MLRRRAVAALSKRYCLYASVPSDLTVTGEDLAKVSKRAEVVKRKPDRRGRIPGKGMEAETVVSHQLALPLAPV